MRFIIYNFLKLLVPMGILMIVVSFIYFSIDYNTTKALKIGVLVGAFGGVGLALLISIALLILSNLKYKIKTSSINIEREKKIEKAEFSKMAIQKKQEGKNTHNRDTSHKLLLIMDIVLAFEVILQAVKSKHIGQVTKKSIRDNIISLQTNEGPIDIFIKSLTRNSVQVTIDAEVNSIHKGLLTEYIREKENSFLNY